MLHELTTSFPTRRSSALIGEQAFGEKRFTRPASGQYKAGKRYKLVVARANMVRRRLLRKRPDDAYMMWGPLPSGLGSAKPQSGHCRRSEEHTSDLQSLMRTSDAVSCLKKKTQINY